MGDMTLLEGLAPIVAALLAAGMVLAEKRWVLLLSLGMAYGVSGALAIGHLAFPIAVSKLLVGALVCAILILARVGRDESGEDQRRGIPQGRAFRVVACLLVASAGLGLSQTQAAFLSAVDPSIRLTSITLLSFGLLAVGLFQSPFRHGLGLLTLLIGFDLAYSVLEPSLAIAVLMAAVHLGIAVAVVYLEVMEMQALSGGADL